MEKLPEKKKEKSGKSKEEEEQKIIQVFQEKKQKIRDAKDDIERVKISLENAPYKSQNDEIKCDYTRLVFVQL